MSDKSQPESEADYAGFDQIGNEDERPVPEIENDEYAGLLAKPWRIQFNFTGAFSKEGDVAEMIEAVIKDAESRGLFFEYNFAGPMDLDDVIAESPLEEVITGRATRHE